ncbi:hypothetical protein WJX74_010877 [Apatococcus lobatus]|uniref:Peptidase A2 domain-containing protein n=1 Tax=Apatococcus lobatus TaxID=904363 RepID=A0AAW1RY66_9CHLO
MHGRVQAVISSRAVPSREKGGFCSRAGGRKGGGASQAGKWDKRSSTWVVHIWLRNDSVDPPVYLQVPAVLDTGAEMPLFLTRRDAQKLQLAEDAVEIPSMTDAGGNQADLVAYRPVQVFVPMMDKPDGQLSFYKHGWLQPTSSKALVGSNFERTMESVAADQAIKTAGQQVVDGRQVIRKVNDKSNAWLQASPSRHPRHDRQMQQHALLGLPAMDILGLHLDRENRGIHTVRLRTIKRAGDID